MRRDILAVLCVLLWIGCGPDAIQPPPVPLPPPPSGNHAPIARIAGPSVTREGAVVSFSAVGSMDPDSEPLSYRWLSGDPRLHIDSTFGGPVEQRWRFVDNGTFTVSVIVRDTSGASDTASMVVTVNNVAPWFMNFATPSWQAVGAAGLTRLEVSDSGSLDTVTVTVDWGDGSHDTRTVDRDRENQLLHTYVATGSYAVRATIRDKDGGTAYRSSAEAVRVFDPTRRLTIGGYEAVDLGTLGGNSARPMDFNDYGQVVGSSTTASGLTHAFSWKNGVMQDLAVAGYVGSEAQQVNNGGVIAGVLSPDGVMDCDHESVPTIWKNGVAQILARSQGMSAYLVASAINENDDLAWTDCTHESSTTWRWRGGQWQRLGGLAEPWSWSHGTAIDERGDIVGAQAVVQCGDGPTPLPHAFAWEVDTTRDLGLLSFKPCDLYPDRPSGYSAALGINERGQIVGLSTAADGSLHAVLWGHGEIRDILSTSAGDDGGSRVVINDAGQVAGSLRGNGFFWSGGTVHLLGSLGTGDTRVVDMNDAGAVVGTSRTPAGEQHVFVWTEAGGMVDLGTGPDGFTGAWAVGISYNGDIVGFTGPCVSWSPPMSCWSSDDVRTIMWRRLTP